MVRQMFRAEVIHSGFWHLFAMTAHSPAGLNPSDFGVIHEGPKFGGFAENDFFHADPTGASHEDFSEGLKVSLFNYMQGVGLDEPLDIWFDMKVPKTKIPNHTIDNWLSEDKTPEIRPNDIVLWLGGAAIELIEISTKKKKNSESSLEYVEIIFSGLQENFSLYCEKTIGEWWIDMLQMIEHKEKVSASEFIHHFEQQTHYAWEDWKQSDVFQWLRDKGLLFV
jgi:hypothetical protein